MRVKHKSTAEKLDQILAMTETINNKVDKQNAEIADLQREMRYLKQSLAEMNKKNHIKALVAGGVGGGIVAVGIELIRLKFGG